MNNNHKILFNYINCLKSYIPLTNIKIFINEIIIIILPKFVLQVSIFLKLHTFTQTKILTSISAVDYPEIEKRFEISYELLSLIYNQRLRIKTYVDEFSFLTSIVEVFSSANWWEREIWDMFGILFLNHPDLRRILTDYGFAGYPLRKCFPLTGYVEVRYNENSKRVVCEPLKQLSQEFRNFKFNTPWINNFN
jgi:NADH dehydrogenase (ubiquinone) Fe-S protein 3